ncbi:Wzz/FepE/Etk N-terminal domain-containing protein [Pararhizobium sp. PWRC1-1]|uniref:Wzz/FepE/Etk N-terminal domain-containing protein n=1 Tax=Pararhizobium sp. PWRC1-1 TaxID=2804566 RepID=UPI003CEECC9C
MYNPPVSLAYPASSGPAVREKPLDIRQLFRFLLSNSLLIVTLTVLFVAIAVIYVTFTPPTYVSSAQLMLESQKATAADAQRTLAEESLVEGQMEIMKSAGVLTAVVESMDLSSDAEFQSDYLPIADSVRSMLSDRARTTDTAGTKPSPEDAQENYTIATLRSRLWIRRVGQSTVIEISAASSDPRKAALIANAVSEAYIAQNVQMKSQAAFQSSEWLAQRVADLQEAVFAADRAVMKFQSSGDPGSQFKLTELKSVAETQHRLYETYLQNWSEAKQRISYPVSDATFVSRASVPIAKSQPKSMLLIAFALILGLSAGVVVAIARHFGNRLITSAHRITTEIGIPCIGEVAQVNRGKAKRKLSPVELLQTGDLAGKPGTREWFDRDMRDLRATLGGLRRSRKANLIGLVGTEAKAGATTLAYNLARLAAASGSKTLLIDASVTNPTLSQTFGEGRAVGLMEVLNDSRAYTDFISRIDRRFTILPIGAFRDVTPGERIGSDRIAFSFADLKERFDLILVDLPSMPESSDAKSIAPYLDGSLIVARHGRSSFDTLAEIINALREVGADILGVVLNGSPHRKN